MHAMQVAVAVMKSFQRAPDGAEDAGAAAGALAKALHDAWGVGLSECDNGALLLLSVEDRQLYISTGRGAAALLTDDMISAVIEAVKPMLRAQRCALHLPACLPACRWPSSLLPKCPPCSPHLPVVHTWPQGTQWPACLPLPADSPLIPCRPNLGAQV